MDKLKTYNELYYEILKQFEQVLTRSRFYEKKRYELCKNKDIYLSSDRRMVRRDRRHNLIRWDLETGNIPHNLFDSGNPNNIKNFFNESGAMTNESKSIGVHIKNYLPDTPTTPVYEIRNKQITNSAIISNGKLLTDYKPSFYSEEIKTGTIKLNGLINKEFDGIDDEIGQAETALNNLSKFHLNITKVAYMSKIVLPKQINVDDLMF